MKLTTQQITDIATKYGLTYPELMAFISVETGGSGFSSTTGKIIIQFEPTWFHKFLVKAGITHTFYSSFDKNIGTRYTLGGTLPDGTPWSFTNGVEGQTSEWSAFDVAFRVDKHSAMLATSIGLMQVMGFNYSDLGYKTIDAMWDDFKTGEQAQVEGACKFIRSNLNLFKALTNKDWAKVAYYYNGPAYATHNYDVKLASNYAKYTTTQA